MNQIDQNPSSDTSNPIDHNEAIRQAIEAQSAALEGIASIALDGIREKKAKEREESTDLQISTDENTILLLDAEKGNANSQFRLGIKYYEGNNIDQNSANGLKWLLLAAKQGNTKAEKYLGCIYANPNSNGVYLNYEEALKWFLLAAEKDNSGAQIRIGYLYYNGNGVDQNYEEALKWFCLAAEKGAPLVCYVIADMYRDGKGVEKDYKKMWEWIDLGKKNEELYGIGYGI